MRDILEQCVKMDRFAHETYRALADSTSDPALATTLDRLAREEGDHVEWWQELVRSWDEGLLPDIVVGPTEVMDELQSRFVEVQAAVPENATTLTPREAVAVAAQLEFYMLYPVFSELIDLVEPAQAGRRHRAYDQHLEHLIEAIHRLAGDDPLINFMAKVLQRVAEDNRALANHATRDALTGLRNRRSLDSLLRQWLAWSFRYGRPLGVLLADLDRFKELNDTYGHATGDRVLAAVAQRLSLTVRGSDMVARYGGDEFAIVAPEADEDEVMALAKRLSDSLYDLDLGIDDESFDLGLSVGAAVIVPGDDEIPTQEALSAADRSLYAAKEAGRGCAGPVRIVP
jgi:diguanylate cyclase (GGDEF)-like protein